MMENENENDIDNDNETGNYEEHVASGDQGSVADDSPDESSPPGTEDSPADTPDESADDEASAPAEEDSSQAEVVAKRTKPKGGFFPFFNKGTREIKQSSAGAGFVGLIGFAAMLLVASVFFITENYFISMFTISIGLLIYVTGLDLIILAFSTFVIFFSSKHLNTRASSMQETIVALKNLLNIRRARDGSIAVGPVDSNVPITLPDNSLSRDIQELVIAGKSFDYAEFVAHSYYVECHELYESSSSNYDFVSATMPLFGLIGTIIGLIAMFDSLGSDVTVESLSPQLALALKTTLYGAIFSSFYKIIGTRFERRMVDLDYDYDAFCRALQVIVENRNTIEIK
jgi:flagellar motor component MotA